MLPNEKTRGVRAKQIALILEKRSKYLILISADETAQLIRPILSICYTYSISLIGAILLKMSTF